MRSLNWSPARRALVVAAVTIAIAVAAPRSHASVVTHMDTETLVRYSDVIVRGRVADVLYVEDAHTGHLHTEVTIEVEEALKGAG